MSTHKPIPAHELGVECVGLFGLPHSLFDHSGTGEDVPFVARCYAASFLAGNSDRGEEYARSIMVPHAERLAPYGITFYDHELMHNPTKLGCAESYHAFVGTCESGQQFYFHCFTRKTIMPRSDRYSLLRTQLMATTLLCGCDDQSGEALARIPLYDTTILCVVTSECCMATLRRAMTAFAAAVPTSESFDDIACTKLYGQLQEVRSIPFRVRHSVDSTGVPNAGLEPVDDVTIEEDTGVVVLPCVVVGASTICLRPQCAHSWERVPYSGVNIPTGICSVESSPGVLQPKVSPRPNDSMDSASRRSHPTPVPSSRTSFPFSSKRVWACPTCHAKALRSKSHASPTHWCLTCRRCNICLTTTFGDDHDRTPCLMRPCEYPLPHQDVDLSILLSRLDAHNVIAVLIALMCDRMVLVVSEDIGILADVVSGILSMLHPFKSERHVIPIGFKSFPTRDMLDYPYPAIMATTPSFLFSQENGEMTNALNASQSSYVSSVMSAGPQVPITVHPDTPSTPVRPPSPHRRSWWQNLLFRMSPAKSGECQVVEAHTPAGTGDPSSPLGSSVRTPTSRRKSIVMERRSTMKLPHQTNETNEDRARRLLAKYDAVVPDQVVIVDLDCNAVSPHATSLDVQLPPRLLYRIFDAVLRYGNVYGASHPDWKQPDPVLSRSVSDDERKVMEARFETVRRQAEASVRAATAKLADAAASNAEAAVMASPFVLSSVPGHVLSSASKPPLPPPQASPAHSPRGLFGSPATRPTPPSSGRQFAFDFQVSPIGECSPLPALAPVTDDALNSDDELSDPIRDVGGNLAFNLVETFPWHVRTRLDALERLKYVAPTQLSEEDISGTARAAVQALLVKIVLGTGGGLLRAPSRDVLLAAGSPSDGDSVLDCIGLSVDRVRMAVLSVMVSLFRSYRMYITAPSTGHVSLHHRRRTVDSDADVITTAKLPLAGHIPSPAEPALPPDHVQPVRRLPTYKDVFLKDEFLAEQTHEESRELLRYCVTQFMPFPNFVSERCQPATHPDLFDRMCFDSMAQRATMYDHIMKTRLDDEVLVLCRRKDKVLCEASMRVGWDVVPLSSDWHWKPVLLTIKSGECMLRLTETSPEYDDAREEYIRALLQFHAKTGTYDAVGMKKATCDRLLAMCSAIEIPLYYARTAIIVPNGNKLPRAGPLHYIELQTAPGIDERPDGGLRFILATESPSSKRNWIMHFKSRLRSPKYVESLRSLYLCSAAADSMAALM